jgi:hypothetical protein
MKEHFCAGFHHRAAFGQPASRNAKKSFKLAGKEPEALHRSYAAHFPAAQAIQAQTT